MKEYLKEIVSMRTWSKSLVVLLAILSIVGSASAQSRIAYVDATKLLKLMPEAQDAETRIMQLVNQWNKEVNDMEIEYNRKKIDFDRKKLIMTDGERNAIELDMTELKKKIDQYRIGKYGPTGELATQQENLMKPAYEKFNKAVSEVAADGKYDYVFDKSAKELALLYTNAKFDLTSAVAKKLGLETSDVFNIPLNTKKDEPQQKPPVDPMQKPPQQFNGAPQVAPH
jgi:Skp family chaperone for outer membrane proteins